MTSWQLPKHRETSHDHLGQCDELIPAGLRRLSDEISESGSCPFLTADTPSEEMPERTAYFVRGFIRDSTRAAG